MSHPVTATRSYPYTFQKLQPYPYVYQPSLMYVRVRCPTCGMWTRLENLKRDHVLNEEMSSYSGGRARIIHQRKINSALRDFWIKRLLYVLKRLGWTPEMFVPYVYEEAKSKPKEERVNYVYHQRRESESYPYSY